MKGRGRAIDKVFEELEARLGRRRVSRDPVVLGLHAVDASSYYFVPKDLADRFVLVAPEGPEEVAEVVKVAYSHGVPVIPQGSSTDLSMGGGVVSLTTAYQVETLGGGVVIHTARMNRIPEISDVDRVAEVEPGLRIDSLNEELGGTGLFFPVDPASARAATVGGAIAAGSGGLRGARYGTMRDWVLGVEFVDGIGRIHRTGCRTVKCRQGYDITRLMVGSEGTLGIITKAVLKLWPRPASIARVMAVFKGFRELYAFFMGVRRGRVPMIAEYMDERVSEKVIRNLGLSIPPGHLVILDVEAGSGEEAERILRDLVESARAGGAVHVEGAVSGEEGFERIYMVRRAMFPSFVRMRRRKHVVAEDTAVPLSRIPEYVERLRSLERRHGRDIDLGGHLGDGNLHPHIEGDLDDPEDRRRIFEIAREMVAEAIRLGGTASSEHGIGSMKLDLLIMELRSLGSEHTIDLMRSIKRAFDPKWILNPGRVIPPEG